MDTNCSQTLPKKKEQERMLSNSLYEVRITLIPKKEKTTDLSILLMTIDQKTKFLDKILKNRIQQHIRDYAP